jgi:hypothetical protein
MLQMAKAYPVADVVLATSAEWRGCVSVAQILGVSICRRREGQRLRVHRRMIDLLYVSHEPEVGKFVNPRSSLLCGPYNLMGHDTGSARERSGFSAGAPGAGPGHRMPTMSRRPGSTTGGPTYGRA